MPAFVNDTFTDTNGVLITAHTGEVGATWARLTGLSDNTNAPQIQSNKVSKGADSANWALYYASASPASADYSVTLDMTLSTSANQLVGPMLRAQTGTGYNYAVTGSTTANGFRLRKWTGSHVTLADLTPATGYSAGEVFRMTIDAVGTTIRFKVQRLSNNDWLQTNGLWDTGEVWCITYSDTTDPISAAGKAGFWQYQEANTETIDNFHADQASGDTTAPNLTSPVGTATSQTTATVGATTDEGNGTMYAVVTTSVTQPSIAQIKAGQDHTGAAAPWGGSVAVSSTGAKTLNATGLTLSTNYYAHLLHTDAAANDSNRVSSAQFTTPDAAVRTATITLTSDGTTPVASLTGLKWAWFDQVTPDLFVAPTDKGAVETTDASGVLVLSLPNSALAAAAVGWLVVTDSDGTVGQSPIAKMFSGPVVVE